MKHLLIAFGNDCVAGMESIGHEDTILDKVANLNHDAFGSAITQNPYAVSVLLCLDAAGGDDIPIDMILTDSSAANHSLQEVVRGFLIHKDN